MNIPDDFVFVCDSTSTDRIVASDVNVIVTHYYHINSYASLHCSEDLSTTPIHIFMNHENDTSKKLKKGTKEFNDLLELAYVKQVLK